MRVAVPSNLLNNVSISASGESSVMSKSWANQLLLHSTIGAKTGSPNVTFQIQTSPDRVNWSNLNSITYTNATGNQSQGETNFGKYIKIVWTLTGSGNFTNVDLWITFKG